jgi:double-stranded uracil-DNA glycosylase
MSKCHKMKTNSKHPFSPIVFSNTKVLILGTFPSLKSFENNFYYAHPRNQFWKILEKIFDLPITTKSEKIALCKIKKIGLWDVCQSVDRASSNSSDTNLTNITPNDISTLLKAYPHIKTILFTGKKAQSLYKKHFDTLAINTMLLPSPSPAYASVSIEEKTRTYQNCFLSIF